MGHEGSCCPWMRERASAHLSLDIPNYHNYHSRLDWTGLAADEAAMGLRKGCTSLTQAAQAHVGASWRWWGTSCASLFSNR